MTIKMIAVDMDGTFLNDRKEYNRERFEEIFHQMNEKNIKFVVASGNQYYQLKSFFKEIHKEISFVSENGANIVVEGQDLYHGRIDTKIVHDVLKKINLLKPKAVVACGKRSAYVPKSMSEDAVTEVKFYYPKLKRLEKLEDVIKEEDEIFKFALSFLPEEAVEKLHSLNEVLANELTPVSSGHGDIDLIIPGMHKAYGLAMLSELWGIDSSEMAAFGDSGNDIEMLSYVGSSFAMENAQPKVKEVANCIVGSNNHESVLDTIEHLLD
jgi:Cof subfamily protein (haloacid dehalogenase superfamily)